MKASYDFSFGSSRIKRLEVSPIRAILDRTTELRSEGRKVIPFSAGEPDFNTPELIKQATISAINNNFSRYGSNRGTLKLREGIAKMLLTDTGVSYQPESEIIVTSGAAEAINNVILTFIEDGDEVIVFTPAFVSYSNLIHYAGGVFVDIPLEPEKNFCPDVDVVERAISERTKAIIINNPNNPTGAVYDYDTLQKLAALAIEYNLLIISDEIYSRLVYDDTQFTSMAALEGMKERTVIINGFSKTYAMTGWRLGYIAASEQLIPPILKMHQYSTTCSPTFIQQGLADSLDKEETTADVELMVRAFAKRREMILNGLASVSSLRCVIPKGAFYVMVDVSATGLDGMSFARKLLEEYFVATVPAIGLGASCGDYIRISYATSEENISEGLHRIEQFISSI